MLTSSEQGDLYIVISAFLGDDPSIKQYKDAFSEFTIKVIEKIHSTECRNTIKSRWKSSIISSAI